MAIATIEQTDIRDIICERIHEMVAKGLTLTEASQEMLEELLSDNQMLCDFVRRWGQQAISGLWSERNRSGPERQIAAGKRKISVEEFQNEHSIYDALFEIEDRHWIPLGDMVKRNCEYLQERYSKLALGNYRKAVFFTELAKRLKNNKQNVRQRLTEAELESLAKESNACQI